MEKIWITAGLVFLVSTFLYWKLMRYYSEKLLGEKRYKQWNSRLYFWQGAIFTSTGHNIPLHVYFKMGECFYLLKSVKL